MLIGQPGKGNSSMGVESWGVFLFPAGVLTWQSRLVISSIILFLRVIMHSRHFSLDSMILEYEILNSSASVLQPFCLLPPFHTFPYWILLPMCLPAFSSFLLLLKITWKLTSRYTLMRYYGLIIFLSVKWITTCTTRALTFLLWMPKIFFWLKKEERRVYFPILKGAILNVSDLLPHGVYLDEYMETLNLKMPRLGSDHKR